MNPPFRAEHIGSLVRPPELLRARQEHAAGKLDRERLTAIENDAIRDVVKLQEDVGLQVVTDGEFRRGTYSDSFTRSGITGVSVEMTEDRGFTKSETHGHRMARRIPKVVDRIAWKGPQNAGDFRYLKSVTTRTPKITLPGPCYIHYRAGREHISRDAYPDLDAFWSDLVQAYHRGNALARRGRLHLSADRRDLAGEARRSARARIAGRARRRLARSPAHLYRRHQCRRGRCAERDDGRHPHLPQPGPELAGQCRLRSDRGADVQRHEDRHLFPRIRQCARRHVSRRCGSCRRARSWCSAWWRRRCPSWNPPIS